MIDLITKDIMSSELNILTRMIPDETNDGTDKIQS
jgi:hypothetical protein